MRSVAIFLGLTVLFVLSGCSTGEFVSTNTQSTSTTPATPSVQGSLRGTVHGGQSPVSGSVIQLYDEGVATISSTAQSTPGVAMTDANGNFNITGQYSCLNSTDPVYITSTGGNPGLSGGASITALLS